MTLIASGLTVSAMLGRQRIEVLRDLDFSIGPGKVLGVVGESGAGKSMIGRVLSHSLPGSFAVTGGSLTFSQPGQEPCDLVTMTKPRLANLLGDRIAFIPQEPLSALNPLLTIGAQFDEHLARLGVPRGERLPRMIDACRAVRLQSAKDVLHRYPFQLSGGMCQRVLIAMAFVSKPALVVADEPTTALDVSTQATIVQIMRGLQRDHITALLFITHDLRLAARVCDEILVLHAGEMVERGPARQIFEAPRHPYTRALQAANPPLSGALRRLVTLPEQMPGLAGFARLSGCRFAPRCPVRDAGCAASPQPLREVGPGHVVRCADACLVVKGAHQPDLAAATLQPSDVRQAVSTGEAPVLIVDDVAKHYPGKRDWRGRRGPGVDAVKRASQPERAGW
jgi:peptide/nickel transport system ATP-binding protein